MDADQPFATQSCGSIVFPHRWELDKKGHQCTRCHRREEITNGQKFVVDPQIPEGELRLVQDGITVGRVTGGCE